MEKLPENLPSDHHYTTPEEMRLLRRHELDTGLHDVSDVPTWPPADGTFDPSEDVVIFEL